jgi:phage host-nuclease inhibitor protein Gam
MARIKSKAAQAANTTTEAEVMVARIGEVQRQISRLEHDMNDRLNPIKQQFEDAAKPLKAELSTLQQAVQMWAEANKSELLASKIKTAKLSTGEVGWRTSTPSVRITGLNVVIERLKQLGLAKFLRTKEEVNKEAILAAPTEVEHVKGIAIVQSEMFWIKPFGSEISVESTVKGE